VTTPLYARKKELREKRLEASSASQKLFNTCEDPGLQEQLRQVSSEVEELLKKNRELVSQISYLNTTADMERHRASNEATAESRDCRLERAMNIENQAKALEQQMKSNEKAQEELGKRQEAIEEQMRSW
jgi:hypothetical protein